MPEPHSAPSLHLHPPPPGFDINFHTTYKIKPQQDLFIMPQPVLLILLLATT